MLHQYGILLSDPRLPTQLTRARDITNLESRVLAYVYDSTERMRTFPSSVTRRPIKAAGPRRTRALGCRVHPRDRDPDAIT